MGKIQKISVGLPVCSFLFLYKWKKRKTNTHTFPRKVTNKIFQYISYTTLRWIKVRSRLFFISWERWELWCIPYQRYSVHSRSSTTQLSARGSILNNYFDHAFVFSLSPGSRKKNVGGKLANSFCDLQGSKGGKATTWSRDLKLCFKGQQESTKPSHGTLAQNKSLTISFLSVL